VSSGERRVLHVLPHPGGGGETYVDLLSEMEDYRIDRVYLGPSARAQPALAGGVLAAFRASRQHDLVHVSGEAAAALCLPLMAARPSVVTLHGLHLLRRAAGPARLVALVNLHALVRLADRTICVSESEHRTLARAVRRVSRAVVIRNGVRIRPSLGVRAAVRAELGLEEAEPVAIWVGRLDERKDPLTAARAAAEAGVKLVIVGDGPLRPRLETEQHVLLLGLRSDVPRLLESADVFVLTSTREGLSLALLEALAAGLPAVVSDLVENVEAIGEAGIAVAAGSSGGFAKAMTQAIAVRASMGDAARARAAEMFPASKMIEATRELYDEVLRERQPRKRPFPTAQ
jgi:glycosyltransferase involved in cell wall biosynthesis